MDKSDLAILKALAQNGRSPIKRLAEVSFLSSPAASSRLERLERNGIITGYSAQFNMEALGFHILAFINVSVSPDRRPSLCEYVDSCPNVLECHHVTGNYSILVKAAFRSTVDLESFVSHIQDYGVTQTQVVFSTPVSPRQIVE